MEERLLKEGQRLNERGNAAFNGYSHHRVTICRLRDRQQMHAKMRRTAVIAASASPVAVWRRAVGRLLDSQIVLHGARERAGKATPSEQDRGGQDNQHGLSQKRSHKRSIASQAQEPVWHTHATPCAARMSSARMPQSATRLPLAHCALSEASWDSRDCSAPSLERTRSR